MITAALISALVAVSASAASPQAHNGQTIAPLNRPSRFASAGGNITYNMGAPAHWTTELIYYGNWTTTQKSIVTDFTSGLGASDWWTTSRKYYYQANSTSPKVYIDGQVNIAGSVSDNYSIGKSQSGSDLPNLVQKYISDGTFPEDKNAVYYVLNSEDVSEAALGSAFCTGYCGYHSSTTLKSGSEVYYALSVMAHEFTEAASDPSFNNRAWNDLTGYENGDKLHDPNELGSRDSVLHPGISCIETSIDDHYYWVPSTTTTTTTTRKTRKTKTTTTEVPSTTTATHRPKDQKD
ncbi:hypothetical protein BSLG_006876 [Batrachochytrium salamandrivorans]|nr:hypothetical protein BSLG_006876 [Batrachochytrium salamandrivorans]